MLSESENTTVPKTMRNGLTSKPKISFKRDVALLQANGTVVCRNCMFACGKTDTDNSHSKRID